MSDLKPGKYRMTVEVEIDEEGYLLPHDSGEMFMADWWVQNEATFEPVPPPQCNECGWWLTTNPTACPSCGTPTGLGVSDEDRSEPTPAPREPRVWQEGDPDPAEEGLVIRDADGDEAAYRNGHWDWTVIDGEQVERRPWSWPAGDMAYPATEVLSEVVSPKGTP